MIRHFVWRAVKDSLPTKENLHKRHIPLYETCSLCDEHQETILHALWLCDQAKAVWKSEISFALMYKTQFRSFMDLFEAVLGRGSVFHVAWFSTIAWSLWQRRNKLREKQPSWPLHEVSKRAKDMVTEYFAIHKQPPKVHSGAAPVRWQPPPESLYKANFDAAYFSNLGMAGIGVVVRDSEGEVIAALSQKIRGPHSVDAAEALACNRAVFFAKELSLFSVIVEGDSQRVVEAVINQGSVGTGDLKSYIWSTVYYPFFGGG